MTMERIATRQAPHHRVLCSIGQSAAATFEAGLHSAFLFSTIGLLSPQKYDTGRFHTAKRWVY